MDQGPLPLDHVGIAVSSLAAAQPLFELLTGGSGSALERIESQGVELVFVGEGDGRLELLAPLGPDSPISRHLERRGPGLHHLAYRVPDIRDAIARLEDAGVAPIDHEPRPGAGGHHVAFLDPRTTGGVLIELVEGRGEAGAAR